MPPTSRDRAVAEGRCGECGAGKMPPDIDWEGVRCPDCASRNYKRTKAWRAANPHKARFVNAISHERRLDRLRAAGLCVRCEDPAEPSGRPGKPFKDRCAACRQLAAEWQKDRTAEKRAQAAR